MGTDIHLYSETKKNGKWLADKAASFSVELEEGNAYYHAEMATSYNSNRNYWLFGLLNSNIRTDWEWSFQANGFPTDASTEVVALYKSWDSDAHGACHRTVTELKEKAAMLLLQPESNAKELLSMLNKLIHDLRESPQPNEQRIVFWFDN